MITGILTLVGVVIGWRIQESIERRREAQLLASLPPAYGIANLTPPTFVELSADTPLSTDA